MKVGDRVMLNEHGRGQLPRLTDVKELRAVLEPMTVVGLEDMGSGIVAVDVDGPLSIFEFEQRDFDVIVGGVAKRI